MTIDCIYKTILMMSLYISQLNYNGNMSKNYIAVVNGVLRNCNKIFNVFPV